MQLDTELDILGAAIGNPAITLSTNLDGHHFADARNGAIWDTIRDLHQQGHVTPDPVTIIQAITPTGIRVTPDHIVNLVGRGIPANAPVYATLIRDQWQRRQLHQTLTRASQALTTDEPVDKIIQALDQGIDKSIDTGSVIPKAVTLDEFCDQQLPDEEWIIPRLLAKGDRLVLTGGEGSGKALALDTPLPTPDGWTTMGDVKVGDQVIGADGKPTTVTFATDVMHDHDCYRVTFSDGSVIVADADHLWLTETYASRIRTAQNARRGETKSRGTDQRSKRQHFPAVVTTRQIAETLWARNGHTRNHTINATDPLDLPDRDLPVSPYVLGAWLGDGDTAGGRICIGDDDSAEMLAIMADEGWPATPNSAKYMYGIRGLQVKLREVGVLGDKHIPDEYLRASKAQRLALLQGLMDTDGTVSNAAGKGRGSGAARCEFSVTNERLALDVYELVTSLGIIATVRIGDAKINGRFISKRWRVGFQTELPVFRLKRKADRIIPLRTARTRHRFIVNVETVVSVPVRCIQVDNADHLYLAGKAMVPTHNTTLIRQIAVCAAAGLDPFTYDRIPPKRVLVVDAENPVRIMARRFSEIRQAVWDRHTKTADRLHIARRPEGMDLATAADRLYLHQLCRTYQPDVMVIGPAYKLYIGGAGSREEDLARQVTATLDGLREEFGMGLILEHHSPHAAPGQKRQPRPIGSSLWLRWPEFGMGLVDDRDHLPREMVMRGMRRVELQHWRGGRDNRPWPLHLESGGSLPWGIPDDEIADYA